MTSQYHYCCSLARDPTDAVVHVEERPVRTSLVIIWRHCWASKLYDHQTQQCGHVRRLENNCIRLFASGPTPGFSHAVPSHSHNR
jgi:hypothetical protein